ncbi:MAG TPA: hypothetical protein VJY62_18055 [Bacteroidia bacterium]|nr:hypothetical protein [Bacteroidia bacterium]
MPLTAEDKKNIFNKVKAILEKQCPPMVASKDKEGVYELMGNKSVPYGYNKTIIPGMYFSSAAARKDSVNFYFFPIYFHLDEYKKIRPSILKCHAEKRSAGVEKTGIHEVNYICNSKKYL